jgi:hypothetical protein
MIIALSVGCIIAGVGLIVTGHSGLSAYGLISAGVAGILASTAYRQHCERQLHARRGLSPDRWQQDNWQTESAKIARDASEPR